MRILRQSREDLLKAAKSKEIIIFGAGEMALRLLNAVDIISHVRFFCDCEKSRIGSRLCGIKVEEAERLKSIDPSEAVIVIASGNHQKEMAEQALEFGDFDLYFAKVLVSEIFEHISCELFDNQEEIERAAQMLYDDISRNIYREVVKRRMLYGEADFSDLMIDGDEEYIFPRMFEDRAPSDEIIIDCGAYTGDTVELFNREFGRNLKKIWALECGRFQLAKLNDRVQRLGRLPYSPEIEILPFAASDKEEKLEFYHTAVPNGAFVGASRTFAKNDKYNSEIYQVQAAPLDQLIPEGEPVTMIKMDIEGSEYAALCGAERIIRENKPKLAVAIYHSGVDFFRLIFLIKKMVPEYKIAVRHHKQRHVDTDVYAWI